MRKCMTAVGVVVTLLLCGGTACAGEQSSLLGAGDQQVVQRADGATGSQVEESKAEAQPRRTELGEVVVEAKKPVSAASSDEVRARDYELRPHQTTMEILNNV